MRGVTVGIRASAIENVGCIRVPCIGLNVFLDYSECAFFIYLLDYLLCVLRMCLLSVHILSRFRYGVILLGYQLV